MGWKQDLDKARTLRAHSKEIKSVAGRKTLEEAAERLEDRAAKNVTKIGRRSKKGSQGRISEFVR